MLDPVAWTLQLYIGVWSLATLAALALLVTHRRRLAITRAAYWRFLARPWKLVTFAVAAGFFVLIAPVSGDPTWDFVDASLMSALTFATAPWAVGTLYRALRREATVVATYVAVVAWMFSSSWCYDGWLVLRDGRYPPSWASNILASGVLYLSAGLFWNVADAPGRGIVFGFMLEDWPAHAERPGHRLLGVAAVFALLVAGMMAPFIANALGL
jgi:hypothetical protein